MPGIEPGSLLPQSSVLPLYYTPPSPAIAGFGGQSPLEDREGGKHYFFFPIALIHFVQAFTLLPEGKRTHCKFGYFLFLMVGLYFPRSFLSFQTTAYFLPQIVHCLAIAILSYQKF